jgi:hypothetical protein
VLAVSRGGEHQCSSREVAEAIKPTLSCGGESLLDVPADKLQRRGYAVPTDRERRQFRVFDDAVLKLGAP